MVLRLIMSGRFQRGDEATSDAARLNADEDLSSATAFYVINFSPAHCRAGRAWAGWTQGELAFAAGVGLRSVVQFENGRTSARAVTKRMLLDALENIGLRMLDRGVEEVR